ncbi:threonine ammonia-lyase [Terrilactibacillus sp. BCM23-1]|uniref:L-threonine dehydratase catabolic TdcB n=1 Tax=Terrilactibacillus tamarindi TaxID=2599694 RepID=A0A6N8CLG2_9BACI|nr:threonine ammonia-lyase [Terrilactibacillus tamarindi]MTT30752.1 threonine ammonia-lyase [Terrilactibacillus tamarindi]
MTEAQEHIAPFIHRTPVYQSSTFNRLAGKQLYFKMENLQRTGSFKLRGALNKISHLSAQEEDKGVVAASAGNHAQGVAYSASKKGIPSTIFMPVHTPKAKVNATEAYGAKVVLTGESYQESYEAACDYQKEFGATFVHAYDDPVVMAGQGTIGLEMLQQCSVLDAVVIPIGGGGLIAGVASAIKQLNPKIKVIGVQSEGASAAYNRFYQKGDAVLKHVEGIADGILVKKTGVNTFPIIRCCVDEIVTVSDEEIASTIILMLERQKMFVEGAGAAAIAAVLSGKIQHIGQHIGLVVSGGNVDLDRLPYFSTIAKHSRPKKVYG